MDILLVFGCGFFACVSLAGAALAWAAPRKGSFRKRKYPQGRVVRQSDQDLARREAASKQVDRLHDPSGPAVHYPGEP